MTTSLHVPGSAPVAVPGVIPSPLARPILAHALLLGVAADALLRDGPTGLAFPVWIALVALAMVALGRRGHRFVPRETIGWLATAVLFAALVPWRDAELLQFLDCVAALGALAMAAVSLARPEAGVLAPRLRDTIRGGAAIVRSTIAGLLPIVVQAAFATPRPEGERGGDWLRLRAALVALVLVMVFGALLRGADPIFASMVALPDVDVEDFMSHVAVTGFFAWVTAGWARGALSDAAPAALPARLPFSLGMLDVTAALGALNALFALFLVAQLGWLFGGEAFLRARTGLTAAQYARQGFFQMVWVALLIVPVLLVSRAALGPDRALARRHAMLATPLVGLLALMIVSAMSRMQLYVRFFGLSVDRLYPMVFMAWLLAVLLWLAATVLRDRGRPFAAGVAVSGLATLALLNVASPDRIVARASLARAAAGGSVAGYRTDRAYLARLGGDASAYGIRAALAPVTAPVGAPSRLAEERARCIAASALLTRFGPGSPPARRREATAAWRQWNAGEARGLREVRANARALRAAKHESCAHARAGPRA
ncbi:MAG: hypothetical protein JWL60_1057 [Gemmatimonadetes bacterium]|nr:hypothetical protein [Gemmatimonadota bacterium]